MGTIELAELLARSPRQRATSRLHFMGGRVYLESVCGGWVKRVVADRGEADRREQHMREIWGAAGE